MAAGKLAKTPSSEEDVIRLLKPAAKMDRKVEGALANVGPADVVLVTVASDSYSVAQDSLLRHFVQEQGMGGVYIAVNKPFAAIRKGMERQGLDDKKVRFIDMVSKMSGCSQPKAKNCEYLEAPTNLTELMLVLENSVDEIKQPKKFLIVDSVATLLVYNDVEAVEKLIHAMVGKVGEWKVIAVLLMVLSEDTKGVVQVLGQFCKRVVNIG